MLLLHSFAIVARSIILNYFSLFSRIVVLTRSNKAGYIFHQTRSSRAKACAIMIADHQVVSHIRHARMVVPFKTMSGSKYYGGIAYGCSVIRRCHTDADFTMSISEVFLKGRNRYKIDDEVVVYFSFPTLGVVEPFSPGDFLLFNSLIPHCILSWWKLDDNVMCVSKYLKLSAVGMNNNSLSLTSEQEVLEIRYQSCVSK